MDLARFERIFKVKPLEIYKEGIIGSYNSTLCWYAGNGIAFTTGQIIEDFKLNIEEIRKTEQVKILEV